MTDLDRELDSFAHADVSSSVVGVDAVYGRARQRTVRKRVALGGGAVGLGVAAVTAFTLLAGSSATIETVPPATTAPATSTSTSPSGSASRPATSATPSRPVNRATADPVVGGLAAGVYCGDVTEVGTQDASLTLAPVNYRKNPSSAPVEQDSARHVLGLTGDVKVEMPKPSADGLQDVVPIVGTQQALQLVGSAGEKFEVVVTGDNASRITYVDSRNSAPNGCPAAGAASLDGGPETAGATGSAPAGTTPPASQPAAGKVADGTYCGTVPAASATSFTLKAWTFYVPFTGKPVTKLAGAAIVIPVSPAADVIRGYPPNYNMRSLIHDGDQVLTLAEAMADVAASPTLPFTVDVVDGQVTQAVNGQTSSDTFFHECGLTPENR